MQEIHDNYFYFIVNCVFNYIVLILLIVFMSIGSHNARYNDFRYVIIIY